MAEPEDRDEPFYHDFPYDVGFVHDDIDYEDPTAFEEYYMPFGEAWFNERNGGF